MRKFGIVLGLLAVVALATSAYGMKITNVTTGEVTFQCSYEQGTAGENLQVDTPEIGTWDFHGFWHGERRYDSSQVHHHVHDAASSPEAVTPYYGQLAGRIEGAGNPRPVATAIPTSFPGASDTIRVEFAALALEGIVGLRMNGSAPEFDYLDEENYVEGPGSVYWVGNNGPAWGAPWDSTNALMSQADGYQWFDDAHTVGEWSEYVFEYTNGTTVLDVTVDGTPYQFTNMRPGPANYIAFGAVATGTEITYMDAPRGPPINGCFGADFNCDDGVIDDLDLTILANNWDQCGKTHEQGDANGDGCVDDLDLTALAVAWPRGNLDFPSVPEPATLSLLAVGGLAAFRRRR